MTLQRVAHSIVTRLIVLGIGIILIGAGLRYVLLTSFLREDLAKVVAAQQEALAEYAARDIDHRLSERQALLARLAQTLPPALLAHPAALRDWLAERHEMLPLFSEGLAIVAADGRLLAAYPEAPEKAAARHRGRDYLRTAVNGGGAIGRPYRDEASGEPLLAMAAPIPAAAGGVLGAAVGTTALAAPGFLDLLQHGRIGTTGGYLLVSPRDGIFVTASKPELVLKATAPPGVNPLHDRALAGFRGSGITVNAQGVEELSAIASVPSSGWFVVARIPTAEAFATVSRVQRYILRNIPLVMLFFLLLGAGGLYLLFRPLFAAADHAERMTRGELPLAPLPVTRPDEIGHLTMAFNRLLDKLRSSQDELARLAHHDPLTGLPNRTLLADRLAQSLARAQRSRQLLALLFIDLDGFKPINDTLGHGAGDAALVEITRRLRAALREADTLARVGGDEFVVVLDDLDAERPAAEATASAVADKLLQAVAPPMLLHGLPCHLGLSIGIAIGDRDASADQLMSSADDAMYRAKQAGRRRYLLAAAPA